MFSLHEILIFTRESIWELSVIKCISLAAWQHWHIPRGQQDFSRMARKCNFVGLHVFSCLNCSWYHKGINYFWIKTHIKTPSIYTQNLCFLTHSLRHQEGFKFRNRHFHVNIQLYSIPWKSYSYIYRTRFISIKFLLFLKWVSAHKQTV